MQQLSFTDEEVAAVKSLLAEVRTQYTSVEDADFLMNAPLIAHELPRTVRAFFNYFKHAEPQPGACVVGPARPGWKAGAPQP